MPALNSFIYERFGSILLPLNDGVQDVSSHVAVLDDVVLADGSAFDSYGTQIAPRAVQTVQLQAKLTDAATARHAQFLALLAALGTRQQLYRRAMLGSAQWTWARLTKVASNASFDVVGYTPVTLDFRLQGATWNGRIYLATPALLSSNLPLDEGYVLDDPGTSVTLTSNPQTINYTNNGPAPARNIVVTVTAPATGSLSSFTITGGNANQGIVGYTGTLAASTTLTIDCGAQTVYNAGTEDYAHLSQSGSNTPNGEFLVLYNGSNSLVYSYVLGSGTGAPTVAVTYAEQWN